MCIRDSIQDGAGHGSGDLLTSASRGSGGSRSGRGGRGSRGSGSSHGGRGGAALDLFYGNFISSAVYIDMISSHN